LSKKQTSTLIFFLAFTALLVAIHPHWISIATAP
jgi:hypothetical protein